MSNINPDNSKPNYYSGETDEMVTDEHIPSPAPAVAPYDPRAGMRAQVEYDNAKKSTTVAYLLILFFGGLGIHNFYLGKTNVAITQLVLTLIGWATVVFVVGFAFLIAVFIWVVVDLFMIPGHVQYLNEAEWDKVSRRHGIN